MVSTRLIVEGQELCALGSPEVRKRSGCRSEVVEIDDLAEVATLEAAAPLAKAEGPYGTKYYSGRAREAVQAQTGIEAVRVDSFVGGSYDSVADRTGDVVWEEGAAVAADTAWHNRRTWLSCKVPVVCLTLLLTRAVSSPWRERKKKCDFGAHASQAHGALREGACKRRQ
jgi:hypothetical protein